MSPNSLKGKRIPFVLNPKTGEELRTGNRDVAKVYALLTNPSLGECIAEGNKPIHECESLLDFLSMFRSVINNWQIEDQLIFYFSGHGDIQGNQYCLKLGLNNSDWLPFQNLINELGRCSVKRAIFILDACFSGAAVEGVKGSSNFASIREDDIPKGIAIIASCKKSQVSRELPDASAGVFTRIFCDAIETGLGGKGTEDGFIYVEDLINYINNRLATDEKYSDFPQQPVFKIDHADKGIWIARAPRRSNPSPPAQHSPISKPYELKLLYDQTSPNRHPCLEASIDDLDLGLLNQFLEANSDSLRRELARKFSENNDFSNRNFLLEVLSRLKLYSPIRVVGQNYLHQAAVLCFCRQPELIYPQARAIFTVGNPRDPNFIREDIEGPLSYQVTALVERVGKYSEKISYIAEDGLRHEVDRIDSNVARELISNAIAHRAYQSRGTVKVAITPEALEVYSPGDFPSGLSWNNLINNLEINSYPVDAAITYYLTKLRVFEGIGRGFDVFKQYIKDNGRYSLICQELDNPPAVCIRVPHRGKSQVIREVPTPNTDPPYGGWEFVIT